MCDLLRALRTAPCSAIRVKGRTVTGAHTTNHMLLNRTRTKAFVSCGLIISAIWATVKKRYRPISLRSSLENFGPGGSPVIQSFTDDFCPGSLEQPVTLASIIEIMTGSS